MPHPAALTNFDEIDRFAEDQATGKLLARRNWAWAAWIERGIARALCVVPHPIRRLVHFLLSVDHYLPLWRRFEFMQAFMTGVLALMIFLLWTLIIALIGGHELVHQWWWMGFEASVIGAMAAWVWCNRFSPCPLDVGKEVNQVCEKHEPWAEVAARWIALRGTLRIEDAYFLLHVSHEAQSLKEAMTNELMLTGEAIPPCPQSIAGGVRKIFDRAWNSLYGGNLRARQALDVQLRKGNLGRVIEHATLARDTPKAQSASPRSRL